jgi:hypothetical protein
VRASNKLIVAVDLWLSAVRISGSSGVRQFGKRPPLKRRWRELEHKAPIDKQIRLLIAVTIIPSAKMVVTNPVYPPLYRFMGLSGYYVSSGNLFGPNPADWERLAGPFFTTL